MTYSEYGAEVVNPPVYLGITQVTTFISQNDLEDLTSLVYPHFPVRTCLLFKGENKEDRS